jgi:hypothetical protein
MSRQSISLVIRYLFLTTALSACSGGADIATGLRPTALRANDSDPNPVVQSLTGHWEVIGSAGNLNKISVTAEKRLDGTVTGEVQFERFTDEGLSILAHGTILCLRVDGNVARLAAAGEETVDGTTTPVFGILTAIDNGEGNPNPDKATNLLGVMVEEHALSHCGATPLVPDTRALPIQRGNLVVRS